MNALEKILAQPKVVHDLAQGTPEWDSFRLQHRGGSEIAAVLGLSRYVTRTELLSAKHTGIAREFSDFVQKRVLDKGHAVEALARPIIEAQLGEDLYPVTCSRGGLSASVDGITLDDDTAFEHKQWNDDLAAMVATGNVPDEHMPQCQQILLVTGARRVLFVVSDGTPDKMVQAEVLPDRAWWERIAAGWEQFDRDLAEYVPREATPRAQAAPVESLPAVSVQVSGSIAVQTNLDLFAGKLRAFVASIPKQPASDQEFADAEAACKALKKAEETIKAAGDSAIAQVSTVEELTRQLNDLGKLARDARLATEKLVTARKQELKQAEVIRGRTAIQQHWAHLNERLGHAYMPVPSADVMDFAGAISGLKSLDSVRNAIDTKIAAGKIAGNEIADGIEGNLRHLREHASEHRHLFPDTGALVLKAADDLKAVVTARISAFEEQERARKQREAEEAEARRLREALQRQEREQQAAREAEARQQQASPEVPAGAPAVVPGNVLPIRAAAPAVQDEKPTLTLGEINTRLDITMTSAFVRQLGVTGTPGQRAGVFTYTESEFQLIAESLKAHITTAQHKALERQREAA